MLNLGYSILLEALSSDRLSYRVVLAYFPHQHAGPNVNYSSCIKWAPPSRAVGCPTLRLRDVQRLADERCSPQTEDDGDEMDFATAAFCAPERDGAPR